MDCLKNKVLLHIYNILDDCFSIDNIKNHSSLWSNHYLSVLIDNDDVDVFQDLVKVKFDEQDKEQKSYLNAVEEAIDEVDSASYICSESLAYKL